jgi:hypothetical protein
MPAPAIEIRPTRHRGEICTPAEREAAARITAEIADKPIRKVTTAYLMTLPAHAQAYAAGKRLEKMRDRKRQDARARARKVAEGQWGQP